MHELIRDITFSILFAWLLGLGAHFFRQPLILAYLVAGFAIGPYGVGWVKSQESISTISELGLIFMLFMIGLEIDLKKIIRAGRVILFAAGGQLIGACVLGLAFFVAIGLSLGGGKFDALYLTVACALSSTVIIVKVLYEKRELDTLPGRITLGVLVLQDIFAILFLAGAAQPRRFADQYRTVVDRPRRAAGGDGDDPQPLRAAEDLSPDRAQSRTGHAWRSGMVLPDRRSRRTPAFVA